MGEELELRGRFLEHLRGKPVALPEIVPLAKLANVLATDETGESDWSTESRINDYLCGGLFTAEDRPVIGQRLGRTVLSHTMTVMPGGGHGLTMEQEQRQKRLANQSPRMEDVLGFRLAALRGGTVRAGLQKAGATAAALDFLSPFKAEPGHRASQRNTVHSIAEKSSPVEGELLPRLLNATHLTAGNRVRPGVLKEKEKELRTSGWKFQSLNSFFKTHLAKLESDEDGNYCPSDVFADLLKRYSFTPPAEVPSAGVASLKRASPF